MVMHFIKINYKILKEISIPAIWAENTKIKSASAFATIKESAAHLESRKGCYIKHKR